MAHSNAGQSGLWERAAMFGHANRPGKLGFNSRRISASPRVSFGDQPNPVVEQMNAFLGPLGLLYGPDGAYRAPKGQAVPEPQKLVKLERQRTEPAAVKVAPAQADAVAVAFARFGKAPAFRQAFTPGGKLRKGWTLVNGAPSWRE